MSYNLTSIMSGNQTGVYTFVKGVNDVLMFGFLGDIFLIGLAVVMFTSFYLSTNDISRSMIGTFFITFILSLSLVALGLAHSLCIFITLFGTILGVVLSYGNS